MPYYIRSQKSLKLNGDGVILSNDSISDNDTSDDTCSEIKSGDEEYTSGDDELSEGSNPDEEDSDEEYVEEEEEEEEEDKNVSSAEEEDLEDFIVEEDDDWILEREHPLTQLLQSVVQSRYDVEQEEKRLPPIEKKKLAKIKKSIKNRTPSLKKILRSHLSFPELQNIIELFSILQTLETPSRTYNYLRDEIVDILKSHKNIDRDSLKFYEKEEKRLIHTNRTFKPIRYQILEKEASDKVKKELLHMHERLQRYDTESSQYASLREKLKWALSLPYRKIIKPTLDPMDYRGINIYCTHIKAKLDEQIYGMDQVKEEMLETVVNRITNPHHKHGHIALKGKPGVGKTVICQTLAKALDLPFERIALGGLKDSSLLKGNDNVWVGAEPSLILKALKRMKYANGIIFFDEIDKLGESTGGFEVQSALLHITDPSQNMEFKDDFLSEFPHDISKILFLFAMNDDSLLSAPLRDRLRILNIPSYSNKDKIEIMKKHLLPQALDNLGMSHSDVTLTTEGALAILAKIDKTQSEGIRTLRQIINKIVSRINFLHHVTLPDGSTGALAPSFITRCSFPLAISGHHVDKLWPPDQFSSFPAMSMMYL